MKKLIEKLKQNDYRTFFVFEREQIEFVDPEDFDYAQEGYRFNPKTNEQIEDWNEIVGENFYVIGNETDLGDPIIADAGTEGFPVYFMMHDDWESIEKIANSFDEFVANLKAIEELIKVPNQDRETIKNFIETLDEKNNTDGFYQLMCFDVLDEDGFYYDQMPETKE